MGSPNEAIWLVHSHYYNHIQMLKHQHFLHTFIIMRLTNKLMYGHGCSATDFLSDNHHIPRSCREILLMYIYFFRHADLVNEITGWKRDQSQMFCSPKQRTWHRYCAVQTIIILCSKWQGNLKKWYMIPLIMHITAEWNMKQWECSSSS